MVPGPVTPRQLEVLKVIELQIERCGFAPTLEEIAAQLHLSAVSTVAKHVLALERAGRIMRTRGQARGIVVLKTCKQRFRVCPRCGFSLKVEYVAGGGE